MAVPKCPACNTAKHVRPVGVVGDMFVCGKCGGGLDGDPDEGGDYGNNPAARIERSERRERKHLKGGL